MAEIRDLGRLPRFFSRNLWGDNQFAENLLAKRDTRRLTEAHHAELAELDRRSMPPLTEVNAPPEPMNPFADEAANLLVQDVLMAAKGTRPRHVMRGIAGYREYMEAPAALQNVVHKYKDQVPDGYSFHWTRSICHRRRDL